MRVFVVTGIVLVAIATISCMISTDISYWLHNYANKEHSGLWKKCHKIRTDVMECVSLIDFDQPAWFQTVRVFAVAGCILLLASTIVAGVYVRDLDHRLLPLVASSLGIFGGVCCVVSLLVFGVGVKEQKFYLGASFYLQIPAAFLAFTAAALFIGARWIVGDGGNGYDAI